MLDAFLTVAALAAAVTAVVVAVRTLTTVRPLRWLFGRLVTEPAEEAMGRVILREVTPLLGAALAELRPDGGSSTRDAIDRIDRRLATVEARLHVLEHLGEQQDEVDTLGRQGRVERRDR